MLEVLINNYTKLTHLNFRTFSHDLVTARIINAGDNQNIQRTIDNHQVAALVLDKIDRSLKAGVTTLFERFLTILENDDDLCCNNLANRMREEFSENTTGRVTISECSCNVMCSLSC